MSDEIITRMERCGIRESCSIFSLFRPCTRTTQGVSMSYTRLNSGSCPVMEIYAEGHI